MTSSTSFDLIVVGSGAAGLSAALRAADLGARVAVLTAGPLLAGSSPRAQGGVAAAIGADDTPALHARDTLLVGAGLNDAGAVDVLTRAGTRSVQSLRAAGVPFAEDLGLEAGHARRRILHAGGGATGQVLTSALLARAQANPRIALFDHAPVTALTLEHGRVVGVEIARRSSRELWDVDRPSGDASTPPSADVSARLAGDASARVAGDASARLSGDVSARLAGDVSARLSGDVSAPRATATRRLAGRAVILATGGYAALWARTTNASETRGSGLALAYQAGAALADLEFVQFHPTALALENAPALLLSEALRGEGARLVDSRDRDVVNPLLPRDVLARALHRELSRGQTVYLSLRHLDADHVYAHFSALADEVEAVSGLDLAQDRLPVAPAAHYCMGGIRTDTWGRTDVPGLYAAGETACSGVQGANRLASNSLLECLVFGARTAEAALDDAPDAAATWHTAPLATQRSDETSGALSLSKGEDPTLIGATLDRDVGVERTGLSLERLAATLPDPDSTGSEAHLVTSLITRAALLRRESRGAHFRIDYPEPDPAWRGRIHWRRGQQPVFEEVCA
jgi:L-aspartate oxidase